jgi:hypothetical protein
LIPCDQCTKWTAKSSTTKWRTSTKVTCPNSSHSSLTWMAPMQSSNTGIKSARKSAWILKSSLPPLTEDAQSTYWRSWSLNSQTGSVRKTFFHLSPISCQSPSESPIIILQSLSTLGFLSRRQTNGLAGRSIRCSLSNPPTRGNHLSITVQTCCHRVVYLQRIRA